MDIPDFGVGLRFNTLSSEERLVGGRGDLRDRVPCHIFDKYLLYRASYAGSPSLLVDILHRRNRELRVFYSSRFTL